jgi:hypothetical protein
MRLHGATSHKTLNFILASVRTRILTSVELFSFATAVSELHDRTLILVPSAWIQITKLVPYAMYGVSLT